MSAGAGQAKLTRDGLELKGFLTEDQLRVALADFAERIKEHDEIFVNVAQGTTNASGNLTLTLFEVPAMFQAEIHSIVCEAAGYTPASPYSSATAWLGVYRGAAAMGALVDFTPSTTGIFPNRFSYGSDAPIVRSSTKLILSVNGGPASTSIVCSIQGVLEPVVTP